MSPITQAEPKPDLQYHKYPREIYFLITLFCACITKTEIIKRWNMSSEKLNDLSTQLHAREKQQQH